MTAVLYDWWRSSASWRVRIALHLAGIAFRAVPVNLVAGEQAAPANLARNPQGVVPTLEIDGLRLTQSLAIVGYLDETRGLGLLPADAAGRARVRAIAHAIAMDIHPVCNLSVARHAAAAGGAITLEGWMRHFIGPRLAAVEALAAGRGPYAHGDRISLADLVIVPQLYNARRYGVDLGPLPRLAAIDAALADHPAFAAAHPDRYRPEGAPP